jgi:hypothetical protein
MVHVGMIYWIHYHGKLIAHLEEQELDARILRVYKLYLNDTTQWGDAKCNVDPRVFQAFVWKEQ